MRGTSRKESGGSGHPRGNSASNGPGSSFYESDSVKKNYDERLDFLLVNSIGSRAVVTVSSGVKYDGILAACNPHSSPNGIDVVLKFPKILDKGLDTSDINTLSAALSETLVISASDVSEIEINDVALNADEKWEQDKAKEAAVAKDSASKDAQKKKEFKTDTAISGAAAQVSERELQKWAPDDEETFPLNHTSLEDDQGGWDQFAVNEKKFGIKPSYDEHFYTTRINKDDPEYKKKLKEAEKIAKDIESQGSSGNVHIDEDRNLAFEDSGLDEEDKYSGVDRRGDELLAQLKLNAKPESKQIRYVPPSLRSQPHHADPAILSSTSSSARKHKSSTRTEIADLKKFSEKFKIPYDMPDEIKTILKKDEHEGKEASEVKPVRKPAHKVVEKDSEKEKEKELQQPISTSSAASSSTPTPSAAAKPSGTLKANPSLPPKPASQPPSTPTLQPANGVKTSSRSSKAGTPSTGKVELRRSSQNKFNSGGRTPVASPSVPRTETFGRRRQRNFFEEGEPKCLKKDLDKNFNMFLKAKEAHEEKGKNSEGKDLEHFFIEKPYFTSPTWMSTVDQSYKSFFPDERTAIQRTQMRLQQRSINMMAQGMAGGPGGMPMNMPVGVPPGATPFMSGHPVAGGGSPAGMFMPFQPQPMFYPPMGGQMMPIMNNRNDARNGSGSSSQSSSPPATPAFMSAVPMSVPYGYPMRYQTMSGPPPQHQQNQYHSNNHRNYKQHNDNR